MSFFKVNDKKIYTTQVFSHGNDFIIKMNVVLNVYKHMKINLHKSQDRGSKD